MRIAGTRHRALLLLATLGLACRSASAPPPTEAVPRSLGADVFYLASAPLAGRVTGSAGNDRAANFLARGYAVLGLPGAFAESCAGVPCPAAYFQYFTGAGVSGHNVGVVVRGTDSTLGTQFVVVGAHYDHLGTSPRFALDPELGTAMRPGADDNASGTAAVLELARRLAARPLARSVLLVHFDAEEWGMIGSRAFVERPPVDRRAMVLMLNLDMVGRLRGRDLLIDGPAEDARPRALADSVTRALGVRSATSSISAGRSDHASFGAVHIPAISLMTGFHGDYHRITDVPARIDVVGLARVVAVAEGIVRAAGSSGWSPRPR